MAFNGDGFKRQRMEGDFKPYNADQNSGYDGEPRRKRFFPGQRGQGDESKINNPGGLRENEKCNHVLLFTVFNPVYPITVDVLHTICTPNGEVFRIVIFKKNGVQALVEFDSVDSAKRAKDSLDGKDIYSGCCTLKVEYGKPDKLNVYKNDSETWDYTKSDVGARPTDRPAPLLRDPRVGGPGPRPYGNGFHGEDSSCGPPPLDVYHDDEYGNTESVLDVYGDRYPPNRPGMKSPYGGHETRHPPSHRRPDFAPSSLTQTSQGNNAQPGSVLMVYGLSPQGINCDKLFNLFCLYGNVFRIKFLKTKEGCAMIQMGDSLAVEHCIHNLNGSIIMGSTIQLSLSKQAFLSEVHNPYSLPDMTYSFKDFTGNRNNRFLNPGMAQKNRIHPPSKILHFYNTPPDVTEEKLMKVFEENNAPAPATVKLFPSKTTRSSSGLLEFEDVSAALEALMICNHLPIHNTAVGKFPYIMKLCFSSARSIAAGSQQSGRGNQGEQAMDLVNKEDLE